MENMHSDSMVLRAELSEGNAISRKRCLNILLGR